MEKAITREQAKEFFFYTFNQLYHLTFGGSSPYEKRTAEQIRLIQTSQDLVQLTFKDDYKEALEAMSMEGFTEYFNLVGTLSTRMKLALRDDFKTARLVSAQTLGSDMTRAKDASEISALVAGFTPLEIVKLSYTQKMSAVNSILDDWFVFDDKEQALLTLIAAMDEEERKKFFAALMDGKDPLLSKLLSKVNGAEKVSLFMYINTLLLMSGIDTSARGVPPAVRNDFWAGKMFSATYDRNQIRIVQFQQNLLLGPTITNTRF